MVVGCRRACRNSVVFLLLAGSGVGVVLSSCCCPVVAVLLSCCCRAVVVLLSCCCPVVLRVKPGRCTGVARLLLFCMASVCMYTSLHSVLLVFPLRSRQPYMGDL